MLRSNSKDLEHHKRKSQLARSVAKENEKKLSLYEKKLKVKADNDIKVAQAKLDIAKQIAELNSRNLSETQNIKEINKMAKDQTKYGHGNSQRFSEKSYCKHQSSDFRRK